MASRTEHSASWRKAGRASVEIMHKSLEYLSVPADRPSDDRSDLSVQGWRLLEAGQREQARKSFQAALEHNPYAIGIWLGLSRVVDTVEERRACLQAAIDLQDCL